MVNQVRANRICRVRGQSSKQSVLQFGIEALTEFMKDIGVSHKGINLQDEKAIERLMMRIHRFSGHCSAQVLAKAMSHFDLTVRVSDLSDFIENCDTCRHSKKNAKTISKQERERDLIIAYTDLTQLNKEGIGNVKWVATFVDDADEMIFTAPLKRKSDFFHVLVTYLKNFPHIDILRSDNAPEIIQSTTKELLARNNVAHETTAPDSSESIGKVERTHQRIKRLIEKGMVDLGFHDNPELWPWILPYATSA